MEMKDFGEIIFLLNCLFGAVAGVVESRGRDMGEKSWRGPLVLKFGSGGGVIIQAVPAVFLVGKKEGPVSPSSHDSNIIDLSMDVNFPLAWAW